MKLLESFKIALNIILHSKLRSWLTILGIVIGIAAIVSIVSVGQGAQKSVEDNLNSLSADIITVSPGFSHAMGGGPEFRTGSFNDRPTTSQTKNLTSHDILILKGLKNIDQVTGTISGSTEVSYNSKTTKISIQGVDVSIWKNIITTELASGRYLAKGDVNSVVVGSRIANSTFPDLEINRQIIINGTSFRVVGILKESVNNEDNKIFMPIESAVNLLPDKIKDNFDSITIKVKDISLTDETITEITNSLLLSHGIFGNKKQDFSVTSLKTMQERITSTLSTISIFLGAIAAISLIVGAIGIMNSMFTSVLEKTKEIGILKAVGAKNRDILAIFLFNSAVIGFIGGLIGVILGIISSGFIGGLVSSSSSAMGPMRFNLSSTYISPTFILLVFVISIIVGLIAGVVPAYRASKLKPIDALRFE